MYFLGKKKKCIKNFEKEKILKQKINGKVFKVRNTVKFSLIKGFIKL